MNPKFLVQNATARGKSRIGRRTNLRPRITDSNLPAVRTFAIAGALVLLTAGSAHAQRLAPRFATVPEPFAVSAAQPRAAAVAFGHPKDHRLEGAIVGGVVVGAGLALFSNALCGLGDEPASQCAGLVFEYFLLGGAIGGLLGALVGSTFPKPSPAP